MNFCTFENTFTTAGKDGHALSDQFEDLAKLLQQALDAGKDPEVAGVGCWEDFTYHRAMKKKHIIPNVGCLGHIFFERNS